MEKIVHYCWFGGKPLPKLAKKCIKSWKKYLPDYEIMEWNESNFDVNSTNFSKQAYKEKKWAFVSDVARIYALKNYGGIYFDTDMLITKNVDNIINCDVFAGWESEFNVAVGVLGAVKGNELIDKLWDFYCNNDFSVENVYSLSIPTILTNILKTDYNLEYNHLENQKLKGNINIYARDYFYPISCDKTPNMFTDNTCMVHYYVGSWLSESDKKRIKYQMVFGKKLGNFILNTLVKCKHLLKKIAKIILYPLVVQRRKKHKVERLICDIENFDKQTKLLNKDKYIVFYNKNWLGTQNATKELFDNTIGIEELEDDNLINYIANYIVDNKFNLVVFSAFSYGWNILIRKIRELDSNIIIKVIWHGSNAMNVESYDWKMFEDIFKMHNKNLIDSIGFVKKSMYEFYKLKGYRVEFLLNTVHVSVISNKKNKDNKVKIGLYASGDRWVKNFYNQLGAASLFENPKIDCIPLGEKAIRMANIFKVSVSGLTTSIEHDKLLERMANNDINFYATFSECAPLIPLESLELGVPCITGNNHHYWEGSELRDYLVVDETDNCFKIYEQAKKCLVNKDKILKLYKEWKKDYDKESKKSVEDFLKINI